MDQQLQEIPINKLSVRAFGLWDKNWLLLTSGDYKKGDFNSMTVAWGSIGNMWNIPIAMVVVRPTRFTYEFIEKYSSFTLCGFPEKYRATMNLLGSKSGRDSDKMRECGLTAIGSDLVDSPIFKEADLSIECRKIYLHDYDPSKFMDPRIEKQYPAKNYHRMYFGEIVKITGDSDKYLDS